MIEEYSSDRELFEHLCAPFPADRYKVRPGATNGSKTKALGFAYLQVPDYQDRLDSVLGPANWSHTYRLVDQYTAVCTLTITLTDGRQIVREGYGECRSEGENAGANRLSRAFKNACQALGIGRELDRLPQVWGDYDQAKKRYLDEAEVKARLLAPLYPAKGTGTRSATEKPPARAPQQARELGPKREEQQATGELDKGQLMLSANKLLGRLKLPHGLAHEQYAEAHGLEVKSHWKMNLEELAGFLDWLQARAQIEAPIPATAPTRRARS